jgi:hypothetical protein
MKLKIALATLVLLTTAAHAKTYKLTLDGRCDGFELTETTIYVVGKHLNTDCAGASTVVEGFFTRLDMVKEMIVSEPTDSGVAFTWLVSPNGTWQAWVTSDGVTHNLIASGTWTKGLPGTTRKGRQSKGASGAMHARN